MTAFGDMTEARIREAFAKKAKVSHAAAARLLGCDPDTLRVAGDKRRVRYGLVNGRRVYTEAALRDYIKGLEEWPSAETGHTGPQKAHTSKSMSDSGALDFVAARAQRLKEKQMRSLTNGRPSGGAK